MLIFINLKIKIIYLLICKKIIYFISLGLIKYIFYRNLIKERLVNLFSKISINFERYFI